MWLDILLSSLSLLLTTSLAVMPTVNIVHAQGADQYTFSINSSQYGIPFKDWIAKYSSWYFTIPKQENWNFRNSPNYISKDCSYLQDPASPVFFLPYVGAEQGSVASMTCNVPQNKAILAWIDGGASDYSDPTVKTKTPEELIRLVTQSNIYPNTFGVTLDGHPLAFTNEETYKVQSNLFDLTLPENNIWGETAGPDKAIAQGWWIMLKPLAPGDHVLHYTTGYRDSRSDPTIAPGQGNQSPYIQDVTYHILIK